MKKLFFIGALSVFSFVSCTYESIEPAKTVIPDSIISYSKTIQPLVTTQCSSGTGCHESGSQDGDYTTYDGLKEKAEDGTLQNRVVILKDMPQAGTSYKLTDQERSYFAAWIKQGFQNN
jgi:uncharacterized membrane protein